MAAVACTINSARGCDAEMFPGLIHACMHDGGMRKVTAFSGMMIACLRMLAGIRRKRQA